MKSLKILARNSRLVQLDRSPSHSLGKACSNAIFPFLFTYPRQGFCLHWSWSQQIWGKSGRHKKDWSPVIHRAHIDKLHTYEQYQVLLIYFFILSKVSPSKNHILSKRALFQSRVWCRFMKGIGLPLIKPPTPPPILMREAWLVCDVPSVVSSALKSTYLQEAGPAWLKGALRQSPVGG